MGGETIFNLHHAYGPSFIIFFVQNSGHFVNIIDNIVRISDRSLLHP